jgi:hypothetical protein
VLVIGARGSGEAPQANGGVNPIDYEIDPHHGMGDVTWDSLEAQIGELKGGKT